MKNKLLKLFLFFSLLGFQEMLAVSSSVSDTISVTKKKLYPSDSLLKQNKTTNNPVYPKYFEIAFQAKYDDDAFDYSLTKPKESLRQKLERLIDKLIKTIFGNVDPNKTERYVKVTLWILASFIIGFVLYLLIRFLLKKNGRFFFSKNNKKLGFQSQALKENIHEIDFNKSIAAFENQAEYRSAIRYQFLSVLKHLTDTKQITWNPEKTNQDYSLELKVQHLKQEFEALVYIFDYIWYGEFEIDKGAYNYFKQKFISLKTKEVSNKGQINFEQDSTHHE